MTDWRKIASLRLEAGEGKQQVVLPLDGGFAAIKLRSRAADVEVYQWALQFEDSVIFDLSVNCLREGAESRAVMVAGRRLKGVVVEYATEYLPRFGRLEIWALPKPVVLGNGATRQ